MEYQQKTLSGMDQWTARNGDYVISISKIATYGVTIIGEMLAGRIVNRGFDTLEAAQIWVQNFFEIAATRDITTSQFFVPNNPDSYYSEGTLNQVHKTPDVTRRHSDYEMDTL